MFYGVSDLVGNPRKPVFSQRGSNEFALYRFSPLHKNNVINAPDCVAYLLQSRRGEGN